MRMCPPFPVVVRENRKQVFQAFAPASMSETTFRREADPVTAMMLISPP
jgi:hypothetical protein